MKVVIRIMIAIQNQFINLYYGFRYLWIKKNRFQIMSKEELVNKIINEKKSLCRFGDGELRYIFTEESVGFQETNTEIQIGLKRVLRDEKQNENVIIGIYEPLNKVSKMTRRATIFWMKFVVKYNNTIISKIPTDQLYGPANITRPYMDYRNKNKKIVEEKFELIKKIWNKRDVLIVEGEFTKLGIGNDLFDNCNSIERIICPSKNAFSKYNEIYNSIKKENKDKLILMALGPTATILAYDLSKEGYQCIDVGHIDIEYMWFKKGYKKKSKIDGKYVNEANEFPNNILIEDKSENEYSKQIIRKIVN